MKTNRVSLYCSEAIDYQWSLDVPEHIDSTDADAVWEWANDNELLDFNQCDVVNREMHTEKRHE